MNTCAIVGRVTKTGAGQSKSGKPVAYVTVETEEPWGEKVFKTRFDVSVYGQDYESASKIEKGALVGATGKVGATTHEWQGKTYARLTITGKVFVLAGRPEFPKSEEPDKSEQGYGMNLGKEKPMTSVPTQTTLPTEPIEDDVPF